MKTQTTLLLAFLLSAQCFQAQRLLPLFEDGQDIAKHLQGPDNAVNVLVEHDGLLWMFGELEFVNGADALRHATWDGEQFTATDNGDWPSVQFIRTAASTPQGLIVAMDISGGSEIWRYDGTAWSAIATNLDGRTYDMVYFGESLHVVGDFENLDGTPVNRYIIWDGSEWSSPGSQLDDRIYAIASLEDELYIGGRFENSGGSPAAHIARWNGVDWEQLGAGLDNAVRDISVSADGLVISGSFEGTADGSLGLDRICTWNDMAYEDTYPGLPSTASDTFTEVVGSYVFANSGNPAVGPTSETWLWKDEGWHRFEKDAIQSAVIYQDDIYLASSSGGGNYPMWPFESSFVHRLDPTGYTTVQSGNNVLTGTFTPSLRMFSGTDFSPGLQTGSPEEVSAGQVPATIYALSPWYGGIDEDSLLYMAGSKYYLGNASDLMYNGYGPVSESYDMEYIDRYCAIWSLNTDMIQSHIDNVGTPGYSIPWEIETYPGNGRPEAGESSHLAPFHDANENGWYEPQLGDYPLIPGDQCVTWIVNDVSDGSEWGPGIESIVQVYTFDEGSDDIAHTFFVRMAMTNRSERNYQHFSLGVWADTDIGSPYDDYIGCAPEGNYFYGYNGDALDEPSVSSAGYGSNLPAQAVCFQQDSMYSFMYYNNSGSPVNGDPILPLQYFNYLNATWMNGQALSWGGDGAYASSGTDLDSLTNYMFPDFPWLSDAENWNEITAGNPSSDRRGVGSIEPFIFDSGDSFCFNFSLITAFSEEGPNASVMALDQRVEGVQTWWDGLEAECTWEQFLLGVETPPVESTALLIYPNPGQDWIQLKGWDGLQQEQVRITNVLGHEVMRTVIDPLDPRVDLRSVSPGVYFLRLGNRSAALPFIRE